MNSLRVAHVPVEGERTINDFKVGQHVGFPNGKQTFRIVRITEKEITLAEPISDGGEAHRTTSIVKVIRAEMCHKEAKAT